MPKLIIDNREIDVPKGTKVIDAAEKLGIMIPRFCYHSGLGSLGACRMCAVVFKDGPVQGLEMSCMVEASDGMVVSTTDPEAVSFRKWIIECLMLHHPHDCPVCDEGGHCLLQDETVSGGHGIRRYPGRKRTYRDQNIGNLVQHEMNRCIHCWRCRRFYQDYAGSKDLGSLQIGNRTYFGRFSNGPLESAFSGNLIDLCPTGVFTDKPSRYRGRRWDFERAPSLCIHCSLGCNTVASARYREVIRLEARHNATVNGDFICDRGRYGFGYTSHQDRPRQARVDQKEIPWDQALRMSAEKLENLISTRGSRSVACVGSTRCSIETQGRMVQLCGHMGWREPSFFMDPSFARNTRRAVLRLDSSLVVSMKEVERADFILVVAADPINEAPMLALSMRQASRLGARVVAIDPRPLSLPMSFDHFAVPPRDVSLCLSSLIREALSSMGMKGAGAEALRIYKELPSYHGENGCIHDRIVHLGKELGTSRNPILLCGTDMSGEKMPDLAADSALLLKGAGIDARLLYILPGPNAFGAGLLSRSDASFSDTIAGIESGEIKALLLVEADPFSSFPDLERWIEALKKLELFIVLDYLPTLSVERAHAFLPTATVFETDSYWLNHEGRLQKASYVHRAGSPINQVSGGDHPPRHFLDRIPGGDLKPCHDALAELGSALSRHEEIPFYQDLWTWLANENPIFSNPLPLNAGDPGIRLIPDRAEKEDFPLLGKSITLEDQPKGESFELLLVDWTFGTEELSAYSTHTRGVEKLPLLMMQEEDAARLHLIGGDKVLLRLPGGALEVELWTGRNMAHGVIVMPRHRQLAWQKAGAISRRISVNDIERI